MRTNRENGSENEGRKESGKAAGLPNIVEVENVFNEGETESGQDGIFDGVVDCLDAYAGFVYEADHATFCEFLEHAHHNQRHEHREMRLRDVGFNCFVNVQVWEPDPQILQSHERENRQRAQEKREQQGPAGALSSLKNHNKPDDCRRCREGSCNGNLNELVLS